MPSLLHQPATYEFCFPELDALARVEVDGERVTIRATRDTFTDRRKLSFIRELAAEGFIPDRFQWWGAGTETYLGVAWVVDASWLTLPAAVLRRARRFMVGLLAAGLVAWLAEMCWLFAR